jgi:CheY-like chemotaxis protein
MAASAILLVVVDVAYDGPTALELSRRHPYRLALLDYKIQGMDSVELWGHLKRVYADKVGILVTAFAADATVHAANRRHPVGPFQAGGVGHASAQPGECRASNVRPSGVG